MLDDSFWNTKVPNKELTDKEEEKYDPQEYSHHCENNKFPLLAQWNKDHIVVWMRMDP